MVPFIVLLRFIKFSTKHLQPTILAPSASAALLQFTVGNKPSRSVFSKHTWHLPMLFLSDCYPPRWSLFSISGTVILMKFILIPKTIYSFSLLNLDSFLSPPWH